MSNQTPAHQCHIATISVVADTDILTRKHVSENTKNKMVREFAKTMVRASHCSGAPGYRPGQSLGVIPEESDISKSLNSGGNKTMGPPLVTGAA